MENNDLAVLKTLIEARFDALDARITQLYMQMEKENDRQDVAIERLADRSASLVDLNNLLRRYEKLDRKVETHEKTITNLTYRVKVTWAVGAAILGATGTLLLEYIQRQLGL